jgi:hypothetical protein
VTNRFPPCDDPTLAVQPPPLTLSGLRRYALDRTPVGSFLTAVLENDLTAAVCRADKAQLAALLPIVFYVHWCPPSAGHGSREAVRKWTERRADS